MTVLIADDDKTIRLMLELTLAMEGFTVLTAEDGVAALEMLSSHPEVEVVLTDVQMPRMGGVELAGEARRQHPRVPLLFMSAGVSEVPGELVAKPFDPSDIAQRLRKAAA